MTLPDERFCFNQHSSCLQCCINNRCTTAEKCRLHYEKGVKNSYIVFLGVILNLFFALALYVFNWTNNSLKLIDTKERKLIEEFQKHELNRIYERERFDSNVSRESEILYSGKSEALDVVEENEYEGSLKTGNSGSYNYENIYERLSYVNDKSGGKTTKDSDNEYKGYD